MSSRAGGVPSITSYELAHNDETMFTATAWTIGSVLGTTGGLPVPYGIPTSALVFCDGTGTRAGCAMPMETEATGTAETIRRLKERSGLTWEQLSRVFGVSRRALHFWVNGGRLNAENAERLQVVESYVDSHDRGDPKATRDALLSRGGHQMSTYEFLVSTAGQTTISPEGLPGDRLGARHDDPDLTGPYVTSQPVRWNKRPRDE